MCVCVCEMALGPDNESHKLMACVLSMAVFTSAPPRSKRTMTTRVQLQAAEAARH
jgi:hypothetical protein